MKARISSIPSEKREASETWYRFEHMCASYVTHQITANDIASRLQRLSKVPMDQSHVRSTKRALRQNRRELTIEPELNAAPLAVKSGKAVGFDGV
jgi:hypothetical protein